MKQLLKDERGDSYILMVGVILSLAAFGLLWVVFKDMSEIIYPVYATISLTLGVNGDPQADWGFDALMYMLAILIVLAPIGMLWHAYQKSTKPNDPYGG